MYVYGAPFDESKLMSIKKAVIHNSGNESLYVFSQLMKWISLSLFVCVFSGVAAQEKPGVTVEIANTVTYSGYSFSGELHLLYGKHNVYGGLRYNWSNSVIPGKPVLGLASGYRYILMDKGNVYACAMGMYENLDFRKIAATGSFVHEIYGALGAGWRFKNEKLGVLTGIGLGGYIESNKTLNYTERNAGGWIRVSGIWRLF